MNIQQRVPLPYPQINLETIIKVIFSVPEFVRLLATFQRNVASGWLPWLWMPLLLGPVWAIPGKRERGTWALVTFAQHLCFELANSAVDKWLAGSVLSLRNSLPMAKLLFSFLRNQLQLGWPGVLGIGPGCLSRIWPWLPTPHLVIFEVLRKSFSGQFVFQFSVL